MSHLLVYVQTLRGCPSHGVPGTNAGCCVLGRTTEVSWAFRRHIVDISHWDQPYRPERPPGCRFCSRLPRKYVRHSGYCIHGHPDDERTRFGSAHRASVSGAVTACIDALSACTCLVLMIVLGATLASPVSNSSPSSVTSAAVNLSNRPTSSHSPLRAQSPKQLLKLVAQAPISAKLPRTHDFYMIAAFLSRPKSHCFSTNQPV